MRQQILSHSAARPYSLLPLLHLCRQPPITICNSAFIPFTMVRKICAPAKPRRDGAHRAKCYRNTCVSSSGPPVDVRRRSQRLQARERQAWYRERARNEPVLPPSPPSPPLAPARAAAPLAASVLHPRLLPHQHAAIDDFFTRLQLAQTENNECSTCHESFSWHSHNSNAV
jgi:hypothetical protein